MIATSKWLIEQWKINASFFKKSSAQVATLVRPRGVRPKSGELKLKRGKPHRLMGRFSDDEKSIVRNKAKAAALSVNEYIRATALGSDFKSRINPELYKALALINRELTAQGRNLNQIARHLNAGIATPKQATIVLEAIRNPLVEALIAVKRALGRASPKPM